MHWKDIQWHVLTIAEKMRHHGQRKGPVTQLPWFDFQVLDGFISDVNHIKGMQRSLAGVGERQTGWTD